MSAKSGPATCFEGRKIQILPCLPIKLDERTDLPEGAELEVVVIDDGLSAEERAELHASLDRALEDSAAGRTMDALEYWER